MVFFLAALMIGHLFLSGCSSYKAEPLFDEAEKALSKGDYPGAVNGYNRLINDFPGSAFAAKSQYRIAYIYNRHLRDRERAMEAYSVVLYMYPGRPEARLARADMAGLYSVAGDHKRAVDEYQKLLGGPDALKYRRLIAGEYLKMNDLRQARIEFEEIAASEDLPPELMPSMLFQIANTYYIGGQAVAAAERFGELIRKYPDDALTPEAKLGLGNALAEAGRPRDALEILRSLEGKYPNQKALKARIDLLEERLKEGPH